MTNPKPTINKIEALAWMNKAAAEARKESAAEIARLREELSRAAVRDGEVRAILEGDLVEIRLDGKYHCRRCGAVGVGREAVVHRESCPLLFPSPLSEAAQEVLEAVVEERCAEQERQVMIGQRQTRDLDYGRLPVAQDARQAAVDRYLALLEGLEENPTP